MAISSQQRPAAPTAHGVPPTPPTARPAQGDAREPSIGDLIGDIGSDLSQLVRDEIELAKAEIKQEASKAGKAVGMLGGAGYAGHLALLLGSLTVVFALAHVMDVAWAALIVTAVWAVVGAVLYATGRKRLRTVNLKPEQTVETLKEDARWARNPMR
ncbi:phage holin family protein [Streptomyces antimicrobicus]|uniref:Phage holin family protein n=1 Tax=Streptomyces antimicrobicus TaxID=2883108 RepID=A0ABS8B0R7_9ACTN|nr:phage holin family protein [Streptomyces antimicrobicus]MCB5178215.1 phage holin family protein [Streptomyces antimicrobicus]